MANNIAFQPMGKTYQVTANTTANTITITADSPVNQYLVVSHEKTNGTGSPVYVRISATSANAALPNANGAYGIPIPPGAMFVFSGPQCGSGKSVYFSAISETDSPEIYITPGEGL
ncbi:MAG: hypothetical protein ACR2JS_03640 [Candidatus Nanopelagicales bacterium]